MTSVLALDLDATKAGVALPTGRLHTLIAPTISRRRTHGQRLIWWHQRLDQLVRFYRPAYMVIEAAVPTPGFTSNGRKAAVHGLAELVATLHAARWLPPVNPATLKKWATGHGDADKAAMVTAAIQLGANPKNDDEADAALLRLYVLETLDSPAAARRWLAG